MKILYMNAQHIGHFAHMYPYYNKLGGLIYVSTEEEANDLRKEYSGLLITTSIEDVNKFKPDIVMFGDYHRILANVKNTKTVMVFHAMENKGYFAIKREWNTCEKFDLCLLYGDKMLKEFKDNGFNINGKIIGYPRFDNIKKVVIPIFDNDKKVILVAPTWSKESLLTKFTDEIIKLSEKYNVIVKPHPHTIARNLSDCNIISLKTLCSAESDTLKIFNNNDILPLMDYSDMLITDISGCSSEYMFFNKPLIIADNGVLPIATGKKPIMWNSLPVCDNPKKLLDFVKSEFENDSMKTERNEYFKNAVYFEDGSTATERGIAAMKELLEGETK